MAPVRSWAHGGASPVVPAVHGIEPGLPDGITVTTRATQAAPLMQIDVTGDQSVEVLQADGQPWLRVSGAGVEVDPSRRDTYTTTSPTGGSIPAAVTAGEVSSRWVRVSSEPRWAWFEHRMHPEGLQLPRVAPPDLTEVVTISEWSVELRTSAGTHLVSGTLELQPITGTVVVELLSQPPNGVTLSVLTGPLPGLFLGLDGAQEVEVLGSAGEPFLRFADGVVEVNTRSVSFRDEQVARGLPAPEDTDATAAPAWQQVASVPRHAWLETRARPDLSLPAGVREGGMVEELVRWEVPIIVDGEEYTVVGVTRWEPLTAAAAGGIGAWAWIVASAGVILGAIALRRRSGTARAG